jgi:hypothetical protein
MLQSGRQSQLKGKHLPENFNKEKGLTVRYSMGKINSALSKGMGEIDV